MLILDAGENHFDARNLYPGIFDVFLKTFLVPNDTDFLFGSEYVKFGTAPAVRPSRPLSSEPILFLAPSPMEWQAWHCLNTFAPFSTSCAKPVAISAVINAAAATNFFIGVSPYGNGICLPDKAEV